MKFHFGLLKNKKLHFELVIQKNKKKLISNYCISRFLCWNEIFENRINAELLEKNIGV